MGKRVGLGRTLGIMRGAFLLEPQFTHTGGGEESRMSCYLSCLSSLERRCTGWELTWTSWILLRVTSSPLVVSKRLDEETKPTGEEKQTNP